MIEGFTWDDPTLDGKNNSKTELHGDKNEK